jgi:hypothetical protein
MKKIIFAGIFTLLSFASFAQTDQPTKRYWTMEEIMKDIELNHPNALPASTMEGQQEDASRKVCSEQTYEYSHECSVIVTTCTHGFLGLHWETHSEEFICL